MQPVLNIEDVKCVEVALTREGVSVSELMHRAGYAAAQEVLELGEALGDLPGADVGVGRRPDAVQDELPLPGLVASAGFGGHVPRVLSASGGCRPRPAPVWKTGSGGEAWQRIDRDSQISHVTAVGQWDCDNRERFS